MNAGVRAAAVAAVAALASGVAVELWCRAAERDVEWLADGRVFRTRPGAHGTGPDGWRAPLPAEGARVDVVVLGDSMTWGPPDAPDAAWPARWAAATGLRVVNLAHFGYDAAQVYATWEAVGRHLRPRAVVWATCTNDVVPTALLSLGGKPAWIGPSLLPRPLAPLHGLSAGVRAAEGAIAARRYAADPDPLARERPDWGFFEASLGRLVEALGPTPLTLYTLPPWSLVGPRESCDARAGGVDGRCALQRSILDGQARRGAAAGARVVDPTELLTDPDAGSRPLDDWLHPTEEGHTQLAHVAASNLP